MRCRSRLITESFEAPLEAEENIATALSCVTTHLITVSMKLINV